jgi:hypothetical protein
MESVMEWGFGVLFTFCKNKQNYEMNKTIFAPMNKTPSVFYVRVLFILFFGRGWGCGG